MNEEIKNMLEKKDYSYCFSNRMGPVTIRSIEYVDEIYIVDIWCNTFGYGSQSATLIFDINGKQQY